MERKEIIGKWILKNNQVVGDSNCELIDSMIKNELEKVGTSEDGWNILYKSRDGKTWELSYPESDLHGGGPPKLCLIEN